MSWFDSLILSQPSTWQAMLWLEHDILAVATGEGYIRLLQYDPAAGQFDEDEYKACGRGVADAVVLPSGHIALATLQARLRTPLLPPPPRMLLL